MTKEIDINYDLICCSELFSLPRQLLQFFSNQNNAFQGDFERIKELEQKVENVVVKTQDLAKKMGYIAKDTSDLKIHNQITDFKLETLKKSMDMMQSKHKLSDYSIMMYVLNQIEDHTVIFEAIKNNDVELLDAYVSSCLDY